MRGDWAGTVTARPSVAATKPSGAGPFDSGLLRPCFSRARHDGAIQSDRTLLRFARPAGTTYPLRSRSQPPLAMTGAGVRQVTRRNRLRAATTGLSFDHRVPSRPALHPARRPFAFRRARCGCQATTGRAMSLTLDLFLLGPRKRVAAAPDTANSCSADSKNLVGAPGLEPGTR